MASVKNNSLSSLTGNKDEDEMFLQPFMYSLDVTRQHIRIKLADCMNYWTKIPADKLQEIDDIILIVHNCMLLLDDIEDNAILRGGIPTSHITFGLSNTMNAIGYCLFLAINKVTSLNHPDALRIVLDNILQLHRGQGIDIYWRENYICPSEEEYNEMSIRKLGASFKMDVDLKQLFSDCQKNFSPLMDMLGLYLQIKDDYCSLCEEKYHQNKNYCEDLSEGKFGYPILHAIRTRPREKLVSHILYKKTDDVELKKYCLRALEERGSFAYTRKVLKEMDQKCRDEVERLGGNPKLVNLLNDLLDYGH